MRSMRNRIYFALAIQLLFAVTLADAQEKPNIVFILADDLGYGDVRAFNAESRIPTPHIDRLAAEGVSFTDAHTPSAVCTPTRYALLTGRYSWRTRLKSGVLNGYGEPLIEAGRATIGSFLRDNGYETGIVGKWHLGLGYARNGETLDFARPVTDGPHTHGFDTSFIIPASLDFPPYIYLRNEFPTRAAVVNQPAIAFPPFLREGPRAADLEMDEVLDDLTGEALGFIESRAQSRQPFFLYFPLTAPHTPIYPNEKFAGKTELGPYGDFVAHVDGVVGQVAAKLDELGIAENTLLIFTSDNGSHMRATSDARDHADDETIQAFRPDRHRSNHVFRGTKADIWEGGHRVPFVARWPGKIKPGETAEPTVGLVDVFATLADLIDANVPAGAAPDSFSFLPLLNGNSFTRPEPLIHHSAQGMFAIRDGDWKLVLGNGSGGREQPRGEPFAKPYQLFNLADDIAEKNNLIDAHTKIAEQLESKFEAIHASDR